MYWRHDRIKELAADWQAQARHVEKQLAADTEPGVDVERAVEVGVVEQALPPECGARLFEVDAHDDVQIVPAVRRPWRPTGGRSPSPLPDRAQSTDRLRRSNDRRPPLRMLMVSARPVRTVAAGDLVRSVLSTNSRR